MGDFERERTEHVGPTEFRKFIPEMVGRMTVAHSSLSRLDLSTEVYEMYCSNHRNGYPPRQARADLKKLFNAYRRGGRDSVQFVLKDWSEEQMVSVAREATKQFAPVLTYVEKI